MPKFQEVNESFSSLSLDATIDLVAAAVEGEARKQSRFNLIGYTGAAMNVGWGMSVVIDLSGLDVGDGVVPILLDHDNSLESVFGQSDSIKINDGQLVAGGKVFEEVENERVARAIALAKSGLRLQASVGTNNQEVLYYDDDETVVVNGREFTGPLYVVAKCTLREISVVVLGADGKTTTDIMAKNKEGIMPKMNEPEPKEPVGTLTVINEEELIAKGREAERKRIADLTACFAGEFPELLATAIKDNWNEDRANKEILAAVRACRTETPPNNSPEAFHGAQKDFDSESLQAALCLHAGLPAIEKRFGEKTLEAARKKWGDGCGLHEVILECARANGYNRRLTIDKGNYHEVMEYAKGNRRDGINAAYFSSISLPEAFAGTIQRFLLDGYESVERVWPEISSRRSVTDFRDYKGIRVSSMDEFEDVGPKGELKHGRPLTEQSYTGSIERKGRIIGIAETDIINDDLGILTRTAQHIGHAAGRTLNKLAWGTFTDNAAFFGSVAPGIQAGALSDVNLEAAITLFKTRKDPSGESYDLTPKILLVGPANEFTARRLLADGVDQITKGNRVIERRNLLAGAGLRIVVTDRISGPEWYLLADPRVAPTLEMAFLNGKDTPTIEQAAAPFDVLGIQFRAVLDAGATMVDPLGGIKYDGIDVP